MLQDDEYGSGIAAVEIALCSPGANPAGIEPTEACPLPWTVVGGAHGAIVAGAGESSGAELQSAGTPLGQVAVPVPGVVIGEAQVDVSRRLTDGTRYFALLRATDGAGHQSTFESDGFTVDVTDPVALPTAKLSMSRRFFASWDEVQVDFHGFTDDDSGIGTAQVCIGPSSVDPSGYVSCASVPAT